MTDQNAGAGRQTADLDGLSVAELLHYVADDDLGYGVSARKKLLGAGIGSIYSDLEHGLRDGNDADHRNGAMDIFVACGRQAVPYLVILLQDADEEVRNFACVMLGDIGNREAVFPLIKALSDADANVSHSAAEALGKIGDRAALYPLVELLKGDFWVQYSAIAALGAMRDFRAVPHLLELLDNEMLAAAVMDALAEIGDPRALYPLGQVLPSLDSVAAGHAAKAMKAIYRAAIDAMNYQNSLVEYHQPEHLKKIVTDSGLEKLRSLLQTSMDCSVLEAVILLLGWYGDAASIGPILAQLQDESMEGAVETALFSLGDKVQPALVAALDDAGDNVKVVALRILRYTNSGVSADRIAALLCSQNCELQLEAIESARHAPTDTYRPLLLEIVKYGQPAAAAVAAEALGCYPFAQLQDDTAAMAAADNAEIRMRGALLLGCVTETGEPCLLDSLLGDADASVRATAVKAAGRLTAALAAPRLGAALGDPDPAVRMSAVRALGEFRCPLLVDDLLAMLDSEDESLCFEVIKTLGVMQAKSAENRLVDFLEHCSSSRRLEYALLETLGSITAATASTIIIERYFTSPDPDIRRLAVETLGRFTDKASLQVVESAINDSHWSVRVAVLQVLGKLGGIDEVPLLLQSINDPDLMVRKHAILVLGDIRALAAIPALVQQLEDMDMSRHAFVSLLKYGTQVLPWLHRYLLKNYTLDIRVRLIDLVGKIGDERSIEPLMEVLDDPSPTIRLAAIDSLACCFDGMLLKKLTNIKKYDAAPEVRERADLALKTFSMERFN
jgi:HEAT repeat protein